jgi:hypothetical protein
MVVRVVLLAGAIVAGSTADPVVAGSDSIEECVDDKVADGVERAVAVALCTRDATDDTSSADDDGTSVGLLIGVGLGGLIVGAVATALWSRRARPATATPAPAPAPMASMPPPGATTADRSRGLVAALIDLSDRMSSRALRAEILAALQSAGVHAIEIPVGAHFDSTTMRGVGGTAAPDPTWTGRVAATERCGFADGANVIRVPEVLVYTQAG